jgi:G protein-coupled receptor Mth (Methuselah protein)
MLLVSVQVVLTHGQLEAQTAIVCVPEIDSSKSDYTDYLMRRIVNPVCHGLAIICYLIIAVVYFIMPELRDLVGNILTSISLCLIISQAADLVSIFTEFTSHVSFLVAGAFFKPTVTLVCDINNIFCTRHSNSL